MRALGWLDWTRPGEEDGWRDNLVWFRRFVLLHMAVRTFLNMPPATTAPSAGALLGWSMIAIAVVGLYRPVALVATRVAAVLVLLDVCRQIPVTANHVFLELVLLSFLSFLDEEKDEEGSLLLASLRWFIAVFFFYTGLQKVLYGYYFRGEFLAFQAGTEDRFALFFKHLIPDGELERLASYNEKLIPGGPFVRYAPRSGAGPYRVDSLLFVAVSNLVYLFEMAGGAALLVPRLRRFAALAAIVFVVFIELGARELTFGALMVNLLLLYVQGPWVRRLFPVFAVFYAYLVGHDLGWFPMFAYSPA